MGKVAQLPAQAYVYVIAAKDGPVKVGIAADAASRCAMLQTGNAADLTVVHKVEVERAAARLIERYAHDLLSADRVRGEWFDVDPADAIAAVDAALDAWRNFPDEDQEPHREATAWQARLRRAGLTQAELARLAGKRENAISEGLRGKGKGGVPVYLRTIIRLWEMSDRSQREMVLNDPEADAGP